MHLEIGGAGYGPAHHPTSRRVELFADWIEMQVLLYAAPLAKATLVDRLEGTGLVKDSDDAWLLIGDAFLSARQRQRNLGQAYPFSIAGDTIEPTGLECTAYRFCLLCSLPEQFTPLRQAYPTEFRDHFEELVAHALGSILPGWSVYQTGWSSIASSGKGKIVQTVAEWARGKFIDDSVFPNANDAQVDVAAVRTFQDGRNAIPVLLGQCATGVTDWKQKMARPNVDRWCQAVQFSARPMRLVAVPFALDDMSFREATVEANGLVLDRTRICGDVGALPDGLAAKLANWLAAASALMPKAA
ncbi:MAG: hypothetical protein JWP50_1525 [Phenylobacterium sp.]|nr:hypothetical protein [Phenylobacterium sp.]